MGLYFFNNLLYNIGVDKIGRCKSMQTITLHYNPNMVKRSNPIHMAVIKSRARSSMTATKKGKQEKLDRIQKQKGWI